MESYYYSDYYSSWIPAWANNRKQNTTFPWKLIFFVTKDPESRISDLWEKIFEKLTTDDKLGYYSGVKMNLICLHVALNSTTDLKDEYGRIRKELEKVKNKEKIKFRCEVRENMLNAGGGFRVRIKGGFSEENLQRMKKELEKELKKMEGLPSSEFYVDKSSEEIDFIVPEKRAVPRRCFPLPLFTCILIFFSTLLVSLFYYDLIQKFLFIYLIVFFTTQIVEQNVKFD